MARARAASTASASRLPLPAAPFGQRVERRFQLSPDRASPCIVVQPRDLRVAHRALSISRTSIGVFLVELEFVDADDHILAPVDARLTARGGFLDAQLRDAGLDRLGHAAHRFDFVDDRLRVRGQRMRQRLDVIRAAERIDDLGHLAFRSAG